MPIRKRISMILRLAIPAMAENILQTVVGLVDTIFVAKLGLVQVTAVGVTNAILNVYIAIFMAIGVGSSALIARSIGAGNLLQAKEIAQKATMIATFAGLFFGLITVLFARPLLSIMGAEPIVLANSVRYFRVVGSASVFIAIMLIFGSILRSSGDTLTPMKVSFWVNIVHIGLDYILIFGLAGFSGLGIIGAALATVIARILGSAVLFHQITKSNLSFRFSLKTLFSYDRLFRAIMRLCVPVAVERIVMRLGQVLYFGLIVHIGMKSYAAHIIAGNMESISVMPAYGLAIAASILVGQNLGANQEKEAYDYGILTTAIAVVLMSTLGVAVYFLSPWFVLLFTHEANVIAMSVTALRIHACSEPAIAIALVVAGALQGAGDTRSPMYSTVVGMWLVRVLGVYILGLKLHMGIAGVWLSIAIDLSLRSVYLLHRYLGLFRGIRKDHGPIITINIPD